mgnify:CR=1 FL=1
MEKTVEQSEYFIERGNLSDLISIRLRLIDFKRYFADFMDEECLDENTPARLLPGPRNAWPGRVFSRCLSGMEGWKFPLFRETGEYICGLSPGRAAEFL